MKKIGLLIVIAALLLGLAGCGGQAPVKEQSQEQNKTLKVGIVQIVEHPALDDARKGFLETLKKGGYEEGKNLKVDYQNAQGDQTILQTIAEKFSSDKPDLILAIATPSAQAIASKITDIPVLITAVTDPLSAKLVKTMEKPGANITGTTDMNPIADQLKLLKDLVPNAKKVGVIYNAGEVNSQVQVDIVKNNAKDLGLEIVEATVSNSSDVLMAAQSLIGKVEAIYVPTDNTVVSAFESVAKITTENKIPVISGESSVVDRGGIGTIGINYLKLGQQTGEMAVKIIKGEAKPQDMAIESQKELDTVINQKAADAIGLTIPQELLAKANKVIK